MSRELHHRTHRALSIEGVVGAVVQRAAVLSRRHGSRAFGFLANDDATPGTGPRRREAPARDARRDARLSNPPRQVMTTTMMMMMTTMKMMMMVMVA